MERFIRFDKKLALETLVSFAAAGVTYCYAPRSPALSWCHKCYTGRSSTWVVEVEIDHPWVAWI